MLGASWLPIDSNAQSAGVWNDFSEYSRVRVPYRNLPGKSSKTPNFRDLTFISSQPLTSTGNSPIRLNPDLRQPMGIKSIAPDFILSQWGVICVGEYRLQQKTGLPLRFRLGSLEYVNTLEGK
jgi:hypothetical protein